MENETTAGMILWLGIIAAFIMNGIMIFRTRTLVNDIKGVIRTRQNLMMVKGTINLSMKLAIYYLAMCGAMLLIYLLLVSKGMPFISMMGKLFVFGVVTLPAGLIGKHFEKKIKNLTVESEDQTLAAAFTDYLSQWERPQYQLKDLNQT